MKDYISFSAINRYLECEAKALAIDKEQFIEPQTEAMMLGKVFESTLTGKKLEPMAGMYKKNGEPYKKVIDTINSALAIRERSDFKNLTNGFDEQVKVEGEGFLGYLDFYNGKDIIELKYLKDTKPVWVDGAKMDFWYGRRYDLQLSIYQRLTNAENVYLAVVTKEVPPMLKLIEFPIRYLVANRLEIDEHKERITIIRDGGMAPRKCGVCDYCRSKSNFIAKEVAKYGLL